MDKTPRKSYDMTIYAEGGRITVLFPVSLILTAVLGGCLGTAVSHVPGKRLRPVLTWAALTVSGSAVFACSAAFHARSLQLRQVLLRCFPDRVSKLVGCAALFAVLCALGLILGCIRARGFGAWVRSASGSRMHRLIRFVIPLCLLVLIFACAALSEPKPLSPIRMSEVCCSNFTLLRDPGSGEYPDYIELVNTGDSPADLGGLYISDKLMDRQRFCLPSRILEPGETILLIADGTDGLADEQEETIRLSFSLKPGETVCLTDTNGVLLDRVTLPERRKNVSMTLLNGEWVQALGTPGESNEDAEIYLPATLDTPVFSLTSGFYREPRTLSITAQRGCEIRYTLDGSVPTEESLLYSGPIDLTDISSQPNRVLNHPNTTKDRSGVVEEPVDKGTMIRAIAYDGSGAHSEVVSALYFIGDFSEYEGKAVLNVTVDPEDLFGERGIAVTGPLYDAWLEAGGEGSAPVMNFFKEGRVWEREAELQLWDENGTLILESPCGIRLQGASSRAGVLKRFSFYAREIYGTGDVFPVQIFSQGLSHKFISRAGVHEVMAQALCADLGLGGQDSRAVSLFVNGEFYQSCFLRENYDETYFQAHYGVDPGELVMIADDKLRYGTEDDYNDYRALMDQLQNGDCADPDFYAYICDQIDVENYAAFFAANLYLKNSDWSVYKNYRMWRTRSADGDGFCDGRWRWLVFDMDACTWKRSAFGDAPRASYDYFSYPAPYTREPYLEMPVFRGLIRSPEFKTLFVQTWLDLMNVSFNYDRALPLLEQYGLTEDAFWPRFLRDRPQYALEMLVRELQLDASPCDLVLKVSDPVGGEIRLNKVTPDLKTGTWTGTYLTGYPVSLTAIPAEGWHFVRWQGDLESDQISVTLPIDGDRVQVTAVFERD